MNAQNKNLVSLLLAALAAGGLGLYAYFGVMKPDEKETQRKDVEQTLFVTQGPEDGGDSSAPVFTALTVEALQSTTVMELQEGVWRVTSPVPARAEKNLVDTLLTQLASTKFRATLEENPTDADLERYGLKPPKASVSARAYVPDAQGGGSQDPARQRTLTFHTGLENTFDGSVYLRRDGDPRVYIANGSLRHAIEKHTNDWRDHTVFSVEEPSLLRIEVKARKNAYTLERTTADKSWKLVRPVELRADAERVTQMISSLKFYRALSFPSPEQEPQLRAALEKPQVEARFVSTLGEPLRVRISEVSSGEARQIYVLAERGAESILAEVDSNTLTVLDLGVSEFKDKKVLAFQAELVQHIVIHSAPGEAIKLTKDMETSKWEVVEPMPARAREFKVASLLGSLEKLKAAAVGESNPKSWAKYGIGVTSRGVSLQDTDGRELARLWLGGEVKGNPQRVWARGVTGEVLELDKSVVDNLPLALEDVMERASSANPTP